MTNKNKNQHIGRNIDGFKRPIQDKKVSKKAASFPSVGSTMSSYTKSATSTPKRTNEIAHTAKAKKKIFTIKRVFLSLLIIILLICGWVGVKFIYNAHKLFGGSIFSVLQTTKLKGESTGRVNILLAGNSADDPGHQGANLTDSILIMSIDTKNNSAFLLSIPRDLWVNIPNNGYNKINDAYVVGQNEKFDENGYFPGGMGQLQQIVQNDFGITVDYYALVDYGALRDAVNAVGGITINIQSSDPRGLYDPSIDYSTHGPLVKLTNGIHVLNGQQALDLARARGDAYGSYGFPNSDFDRTEHQRQMLVALKQKAVTAGVLSNPARLSSLFDAIGNNVTTDFNLSEVHRLYDLVKPIPSSRIQSLSLNNDNGVNLLTDFQSSSGEDALVPAAGTDDYSQIKAFINQQTSTNPLVREGATIEILNGTDTSGLATKEETVLNSQGLDVSGVGNSADSEVTTTIIDNSNGKMPQTLEYLKNKFGNNVTTVDPYRYTYPSSFVVILGNNFPTTTTTSK